MCICVFVCVCLYVSRSLFEGSRSGYLGWVRSFLKGAGPGGSVRSGAGPDTVCVVLWSVLASWGKADLLSLPWPPGGRDKYRDSSADRNTSARTHNLKYKVGRVGKPAGKPRKTTQNNETLQKLRDRAPAGNRRIGTRMGP
jgi:hypothetical protein